jgi:hypothetical protein
MTVVVGQWLLEDAVPARSASSAIPVDRFGRRCLSATFKLRPERAYRFPSTTGRPGSSIASESDGSCTTTSSSVGQDVGQGTQLHCVGEKDNRVPANGRRVA